MFRRLAGRPNTRFVPLRALQVLRSRVGLVKDRDHIVVTTRMPPAAKKGGVPVKVDILTTLYGRQERSWQLQANCMGVDPGPLLSRAGSVDPRGEGGLPGLRRPRGLPGVRPGQRREVRDLGRHERAGAPAGAPGPRHGTPRRGERLARLGSEGSAREASFDGGVVGQAELGVPGAGHGFQHDLGHEADQLGAEHRSTERRDVAEHLVVDVGGADADRVDEVARDLGPGSRRRGRACGPRGTGPSPRPCGPTLATRPRRCRPRAPAAPRPRWRLYAGRPLPGRSRGRNS